MKKLLTMMSVVAAAMSLFAVDAEALSGTSFEGLAAGSYSITAKGSDNGGELGAFTEGTTTYWVTNDTATLEIADYDVENVDMSRPEAFEDYHNYKHLSIKTTLGNPVSRYVNSNQDKESIGNDGLYFDSLVKFTAFDGDQNVNLGTDGKLAIWLKEVYGDGDNADPTGTNLVITAGYVDSDNNYVTTTNYVCSIADDTSGILNDGGWHRVTVRMIDTIFTGTVAPGFVVAIDGNRVLNGDTKFKVPGGSSLTPAAAAFNAEGSLFPSALQEGPDKAKISAVSFDGQGCVDDVVFTRTQPSFLEDRALFVITIGENVASAKYSLNGADPVIITNRFGSSSVSVSLPYEMGTYFTISDVIPAAGYIEDDPELVDGMTEDSGVYAPIANSKLIIKAKPLGATVNGVGYETAKAAFDAITDGEAGVGPFRVTLTAAATSGVELDSASDTVILDLAGNNITAGELDAAAITLIDGTLLVTNSTVTVGEVNGYDGGNAVATVGGALTIAGGIYNGAVDVSGATSLITGGAFSVDDNKDPDSETLPPAPNTDLADAVMDGYALEVVAESTYYTLVEAVTPTTWKVTFLNDDDTTYDEVDVEDGELCVLPETPSKEHYTFLGWYPDNIGSLEPYDFTQPITADVTVKARYEADVYTVSFDSDGGSIQPEDQLVEYLNKATAPEGIPLKEHYLFKCWSEDLTTAFDFANTAIISNTTLTAVYTAEVYTVTFMVDGNLHDTETAEYNTTLAVLPNNPTKSECVFTGWSTNLTEEGVVNLQTLPITGNLTVNAIWTVLPPPEKYEPGESGITPPTGKTPAQFADDINANKATYIDTPSSGVADTDHYVGLFEAVVVGDTVTIQLTATASNDVQTAVNTAATVIPLATVAGGTVSEVTVATVEPGLWYSISSGSTLDGMTEGTRVMATDANKNSFTLTVPTYSGSGFYRVNVNVADKPATP